MGDCREHCPILEGGDCPRHGVNKSPAWVRLCRTSAAYWSAWEQGRGPGQDPQPAPGAPPRPRPVPVQGAFPSAERMVWNLTKAVAEFARDLAVTALTHPTQVAEVFVNEEEYRRRLEICDACHPPDGWRSGGRCAHPDCGCILSVKARARVWKCPIGNWKLC